MARTVSLNLSVTGKDTTNITASGNVTDYIELVQNDIPSDLLDSFNIPVPAGTAAISIKSQAAAVAGVTNVAYMLFITYNITETTPKVQVVEDGSATVANRHKAGMYTSTLTLATTSLANACTVQAFFYKAY